MKGFTFHATHLKIFIAGHNSLVGSALVRKLRGKGFNNLLLKSRNELDLTNQHAVEVSLRMKSRSMFFLAAAIN